ncbi:hypothetical protein PIB30_052143 [Stylosanthes scabra]|uniref:Uncharacterized protein n=1 Tax=Stylosanthes scabra TaxID=79078 RepID=A0ABU6XJB8_9FABA|nr:hypothetical protein [Stylosanthes scabra]
MMWEAAKSGGVREKVVSENGDLASVYRSRVGALMHQCKRFAKVGCLRKDDFTNFMEMITKHTLDLEAKNELCGSLEWVQLMAQQKTALNIESRIRKGFVRRGQGRETMQLRERLKRVQKDANAVYVAN